MTSSIATLFYILEGEEGEDMSHPNALRIQLPAAASGSKSTLRMKDITKAFPLMQLEDGGGYNTSYRFEFKASNTDNINGAPFIWIYVDAKDDQAEIPQFNGTYFANVTDMSKGANQYLSSCVFHARMIRCALSTEPFTTVNTPSS